MPREDKLFRPRWLLDISSNGYSKTELSDEYDDFNDEFDELDELEIKNETDD